MNLEDFYDELSPIQRGLLSTGVLLGLFVVSYLLEFAIYRLLRRITQRNEHLFTVSALRKLRRPLRFTLPVFIAEALLPVLHFTAKWQLWLGHTLHILLIIGLAWTALAGLSLLEQVAQRYYQLENDNSIEARRFRTRFKLVQRVLVAFIIAVAAAAVLMSFHAVRQVGLSLLASAGVAGVILGLAAQRTLGSMIAGIQIAFAQPIRLDDVVVVEGEYGRIEEITLTFVVVRIWDRRCLVLPITYFLDKPFQNWTRQTTDIVGSVFLYGDYTLPVAAVREEFLRLIKTTELWDGKTAELEVTQATTQAVELRCTMSSATPSLNWDLRCFIREQLVAYLQRSHPASLPQLRVQQG